MTDPISDMLTRIKNAYMAKRKTVAIPHSSVKEKIAEIMRNEGYIESFSLSRTSPKKEIQITLRYQGKIPAIDQLKRVSKPGRRIYARTNKLPRTLGGYGITIISTNKGLMTNKQAKKDKVGGEIICEIW